MIGIIPAAGFGTRFYELGKSYPKSILPYENTPLLIHQIKLLKTSGCNDIRIVVGHQSEKIISVLEMFDLLKDVSIIKQEKMLGLSHAIHSALFFDNCRNNKNENVLIVLGDILPYDIRITDKRNRSKLFNQNFISIQNVPDFSRWCIATAKHDYKTNKQYLDKLFDKSKTDPKSRYAVSGIYHFLDKNLLMKLLDEQINDDSTKISSEFQLSTVISRYNEKYPITLENILIKDFGTLEEFLANRKISKSRCFNSIYDHLEYNTSIISKESSKNPEKIYNEYSWLKSLPECFRKFLPEIYDIKINNTDNNCSTVSVSYLMEKLSIPTIRELFLYYDNSEITWKKIFSSIFDDYLTKTTKFPVDNDFLESELHNKLDKRISNLPDGLNYYSDVLNFRNLFKTKISRSGLLSNDIIKRNSGIMHGDLCFSNMFFDNKKTLDNNNNIKIIDPNGKYLFGSRLYDLAKLSHSVIYDYDIIDAELYSIYYKDNNNKCKNINDLSISDIIYLIQSNQIKIKYYNIENSKAKEIFLQYLDKYTTDTEREIIKILTASLFLTMIPLHSHSIINQALFFNKFLTIYKSI